MANQRKITLILTGIFLAALLVLIIGLIIQGRHDYAWNITVKACVWTVYTFLEIKYNLALSHYIRVFVMAVVFSDSLIGLFFNLYVTSAIFDKIQHIAGSYAFSLFAYALLCRWLQPAMSRTFSCILVILLGVSIGACYEIGEFVGDLVARPQVPSQPSLLDTNLDLIADLAGALLAAVHVAFSSTFGRWGNTV